jgi:GntR family transcriptional repressor for pyruvate dehydrogenase complex
VHKLEPLMSAPPRKADVLNEIQEQILDGRLGANQQLPSERELCVAYGVSRPVIREVLATLSESGLVEIVPGRGSFVRAVSSAELSRSLTRAAARSGTSISAQARTDLAFHEAIAMASGNPVLLLMFGAIRGHLYELMLRSHSDQRVREAADPLHEEIAAAIRAGDAERARAAMKRHIEFALDLYGIDVDRPLVEVLAVRGLNGGFPIA